MPFLYYTHNAIVGSATSGTPDTEFDFQAIKPGSRDVRITQITCGGMAAGVTAISGIAFRLKRYTTSGSTLSFANSGIPRDPGTQQAKASVGFVSAPGTGGPLFLGGFSCGAGGPGLWKARNLNSAAALEGSANQSIDLFAVSSTATSLLYFSIDFAE